MTKNPTSAALHELFLRGYEESGLADILCGYKWGRQGTAQFKQAVKEVWAEFEWPHYDSDLAGPLTEWEEAETWRLAEARALAEERAEIARRKAGTVHLADVFKAAQAA